MKPMPCLFDAPPGTPKSPDPLDSPIASSILKGAKEYDKKKVFALSRIPWGKISPVNENGRERELSWLQIDKLTMISADPGISSGMCSFTGPFGDNNVRPVIFCYIDVSTRVLLIDLWNKTVAFRADRDRMLLKATQEITAIFDDSAISRAPRYPTDLWAGYGFSCSLPADLLKGILSISDDVELPEGRPILGRDAKTPSRGLCAVREEDELSEFSGSLSSNSMNSANRVFEKQNRSAFSASTSTFDSSPIVSEFTWDIRVFVDPAMVLAQLGCSEYMTQLREQEASGLVDMHAFLLLDEQNLKDIGVSTIGARKKIYHAIINAFIVRSNEENYGPKVLVHRMI
ncbi:hypothetical protein DICVIV_11233 [Dictyocaulus viviparus]|uniref:SAM domain-containing protein n=1 Tax=Dictyocaulus viviparus TaxID=29172 RepID=A0A0D8XGB2_DICVI|nr:hypothetical protein DICVIV_11233 [Dictyocaulus viviparus]